MLCALHVSADVFKTNEIPVVPAEDLVPPPEDQESLIIRYAPNDSQQKNIFQRLVNWFGFNPNNANSNLPQNQKNRRPPLIPPQAPPPPPPPLSAQKLPQGPRPNSYVFENPAKPFTPQPQQPPAFPNVSNVDHLRYKRFKRDPCGLFSIFSLHFSIESTTARIIV